MQIKKHVLGLVAGVALHGASLAQNSKISQLNKIENTPYINICDLAKNKSYTYIYSCVSRNSDFKEFISTDTLSLKSNDGHIEKAVIKVAAFKKNKNIAYLNILGSSNLYKIIGSDKKKGLTLGSVKCVDERNFNIEPHKTIDSILIRNKTSLPVTEKEKIIIEQQKLKIKYTHSRDSLIELKNKKRNNNPEKKMQIQNELDRLKGTYNYKRDSLLDAFNDYFR